MVGGGFVTRAAVYTPGIKKQRPPSGFPSQETGASLQMHQACPAASKPRLKGHRRFLTGPFFLFRLLTSVCTLGQSSKRPAERREIYPTEQGRTALDGTASRTTHDRPVGFGMGTERLARDSDGAIGYYPRSSVQLFLRVGTFFLIFIICLLPTFCWKLGFAQGACGSISPGRQ